MNEAPRRRPNQKRTRAGADLAAYLGGPDLVAVRRRVPVLAGKDKQRNTSPSNQTTVSGR